MTVNYPAADYWCLTRFMPGASTSGFHPDHPDRIGFVFHPVNVHQQRTGPRWQRALAERPDLLRRLLEGPDKGIRAAKRDVDKHQHQNLTLPDKNTPRYLKEGPSVCMYHLFYAAGAGKQISENRLF
jgi:hypothetical protein